ncbi:twin-arginine translocation signal domain-containing protein, partial [Kibdelosporangium lantanae]
MAGISRRSLLAGAGAATVAGLVPLGRVSPSMP